MPFSRDAVEAELHRIEESAKHSAQSQFEQAKIWRSMNLAIGIPVAALAAVSGAAGLADAANRTVAAILALAAAGLGAVSTTLNAARRADRGQASGNAYLALQTDARQMRTVYLSDLADEVATQRLSELTTRINEINAGADIPARLAYRRGRKNIEDGGQDYEADA